MRFFFKFLYIHFSTLCYSLKWWLISNLLTSIILLFFYSLALTLFRVIDTDRIKIYIQPKNKFLFKLNMSKKTSQQNFSLLKSQLVQKLTCQNVNPWENKPVKSSHTSLYFSVCLSVCLFVCVCVSLSVSI